MAKQIRIKTLDSAKEANRHVLDLLRKNVVVMTPKVVGKVGEPTAKAKKKKK